MSNEKFGAARNTLRPMKPANPAVKLMLQSVLDGSFQPS
jgi:hypothetical protein